jgi:hypothetical protein
MTENADFIAKLRQIEEMANALGAQLGEHTKTRAQHIAILARLLRARLEFANLGIPLSDAAEGARGPETKRPR